MRKCLVKLTEMVYDTPRSGRPTPVKKPGHFHQFGTEAQYSNVGDERISVTVAIVELEDGKVIKADPTDIEFLDKASDH